MKTFILIAALSLSSLQHYAQQFELRSQVALPPSVVGSELVWADIDNDSLLDVLVIGTALDEKQFILLYKVDTIPSDTIPRAILKDSLDAAVKHLSYYLTDADLDNDMDILLSGEWDDGPATMLAVNEGDFNFVLEPFLERSGRILKMADLDQDGRHELMLAEGWGDTTTVSICKQTPTGWETAREWTDTDLASLEVFDFDRDGFNDLFISGTAGDSIVCQLFLGRGDLTFASTAVDYRVAGRTSLADVDGNGYFDLLLAGKDASGRDTTLVVFNDKGVLVAGDSLPALNNTQVFAADLNSDGKCDIHLYGTDAFGNKVNVIRYDNAAYDTLSIDGLQAQRFGDLDRDGDLDLAQSITTTTGLALVLYENMASTVNEPPQAPHNPIALTIFNRLFLYWDKPLDDHTDSVSLTYDLMVQVPGQELIAGEFDYAYLKRLTVSHGNNGNRNFALLRAPASPTYLFGVMAVDNSFHSGGDGGGMCNGVSIHCTALEYEPVEACRNEVLTLSAPGDALWFSFSKGYLAQADHLDFSTETSDTVFYVLPQRGAGCSSIKAYTFQIMEKLAKKTETTKVVCEGQPVTFDTEPGWQHVEWSSVAKGFISNKPSIVFTPTLNDTLRVNLDNGTGCLLQRNTIFKFSKPSISLNGETFQILRGSQVQLGATGGDEYLWSPSAGLNFQNIPDPVASPRANTTYNLTVKDSLGCAAQAKVVVIVEVAAFVPNLFTPNDDGKNDELRIFGLEQVKDFTFTIRNREGSLVYETRNITDAANIGWNGTLHGNQQPAGVYHWKVNGQYPSGRKLLLNGKSSGFIVLIR
ncbi:gliding motility-associated C-terminal domain-containing protein [Fulvivirgaceae bacterium PWU4]|uniref:Gliding motility-associated C-terminal domain-containing protein n=1 Tax=Chryseosolibacter histidini TaxID=2782349 RepID=A0AAP2DH64_9BACT|nr:gliding motility-associated C-terminal domain-containing protein [Chryseosolibacter histidini]MBT1696165.1 gliding motility-associated C-terminal domain-containing protein [Chryseosolibacter histidini]